MIVGSLLLILAAVALLGLGLAQSSSAFLVGSIAASLLAAVALVVGARRAVAARTTVSNAAYDSLGVKGPRPSRGETRTAPADPAMESGRRRAAEDSGYGQDAAARPAGQEAAARPAGQDTGAGPAGQDTAARPATAKSSVGTLPEDDELDQDVVPDQSVSDERGRVSVEFDIDQAADDDDPTDEPAAQIVAPADAAQVARMSATVLVIDGRPRYHLAGCVHLLGRESESLPISEAVELGFTPCSLCEPDSTLLADARRV